VTDHSKIRDYNTEIELAYGTLHETIKVGAIDHALSPLMFQTFGPTCFKL